MKILQVSPFDFSVRGGVNEHVMQLDNQFQLLGHETRILAAASPHLGERDDGHTYLLGTAVPIPSNGSQARIALSPLLLQKVGSFLEQEHFDVVHLHEPLVPMLGLSCLVHSKSLTVGTFHAARNTNFWYLYTKAILDMFVKRLDIRIAVSDAARSFADDHFPGDYLVIPNGISLDRFNPEIRPVGYLNDGRPNILFVGRYDEPRKGFSYLLEAMPDIRSQYPDVRLIVAGAGNKDRHQRYIARYNLEENVYFIGIPDEFMLPRLYASSDVFVAPSTGRESFGIILLESMASGSPVVASDIDGYSAVIGESGVNGILFENKNSQQLALAVVRVLADRELQQTLRNNALNYVQQFSWPNVAKQVLEAYETGLAAGESNRRLDPISEVLVSDG